MPSPDLDAARLEAEEVLARLEPVVVEAEHRVYRSQIRADMVKWEKVRAVGSAAMAALRSLLAATAPVTSSPPPPASEAVIKAAERVSRIYFEIAAEAVGEEHVRAEFKRRHRAELDALAATGAGEEGEK